MENKRLFYLDYGTTNIFQYVKFKNRLPLSLKTDDDIIEGVIISGLIHFLCVKYNN